MNDFNWRNTSIKSDARETLIHSLMASKGWTQGYAIAFVDDYVDMAQPEPSKAVVSALETTQAALQQAYDAMKPMQGLIIFDQAMQAIRDVQQETL